ncbi:MAG: hypothetical protein PHY54_17720 [Methylococcales bacterium]|nr:hypothetical protein [Methylococcales bacterium]
MNKSNLAGAIALISALSTPSQAASMDDYITCSLVYGALFQAAKNADHEDMLSYTRPRLQAVLPYLQQNKDNPRAKARLSEIATRLEDEVKNKFVQQATIAIREEDAEKLKVAMPRVFACDKAFNLTSLPLPIRTTANRTPHWDKFLVGFNEGCLAKQRRNPSPYSDLKIQEYCRCMTNRAATGGLDASSSDEAIAKVISKSHSTCFASIQ